MTQTNEPQAPEERLSRFFQPEQEPHQSLLLTFLDAHLLFGENALPIDELQPFFKAWYPHHDLDEVLSTLIQAGLIQAISKDRYTIPEDRRLRLAKQLGNALESKMTLLPDELLSLQSLMEGFGRYCHEEGIGHIEISSTREMICGRMLHYKGREHWILLRPSLLYYNVPPEGYLLVLCRIAEEAIEAIADLLVAKTNLRNRLALCDLHHAQKVNLTRSDLFVHFERYLRRVYGVRLIPVPEFTQALIDRGMLTLDKG